MIITIDYEERQWQFKLLSTGGQAIATSTHGNASRPFESYLSVGLMTEPSNMPEVFSLLSSLTANHFHGMIVAIGKVKLTSWEVSVSNEQDSVSNEQDSDVLYVCRVGYQVYMPKEQIEYELGS